MSADQSLYQTLREYAVGDTYPCHMPGHKRNAAGGEMADYFAIDITEIEGFDDLHHAEGILRTAQERANRLYGADETFFLVNGSTGGILAAVMAATRPGEEILIARNCHRSVYHAALMQDLKVHYCQPKQIQEYDICDGVSAQEIGRLLDRYPKSKAVVITSPTYEGILSDVAGIAAAVHERGKILIVDEAHGAHLSCGAVTAGADLVIHSLHKTLPSPTQTALLHVNGNRVDRGRLRSYLAMVQSSSPSYILMAGIDVCVRFLEQEGQERFAFFQEQWKGFLQKTAQMHNLCIGKMTDMSEKGLALTAWDMGKILISVKHTDMTGKQLADVLRSDYQIELEMAAATYGLALMTLMDTVEGWQRLADALLQIDDRIEKKRGGEQLRRGSKTAEDVLLEQKSANGGQQDLQTDVKAKDGESPSKVAADEWQQEAALTLAQAFHSESEEILLREAAGRISADFINLYPPGIPLAAPGEKLTQKLLDEIERCLKKGFTVHGVSSAGGIRVIVEIREKMWHY